MEIVGFDCDRKHLLALNRIWSNWRQITVMQLTDHTYFLNSQ